MFDCRALGSNASITSTIGFVKVLAREETPAFCLMDCSIVRCATGRVCSNLRELLEAVRTAPDAVLEHHMMRCPLEDHFELHEFPNELARW